MKKTIILQIIWESLRGPAFLVVSTLLAILLVVFSIPNPVTEIVDNHNVVIKRETHRCDHGLLYGYAINMNGTASAFYEVHELQNGKLVNVTCRSRDTTYAPFIDWRGFGSYVRNKSHEIFQMKFAPNNDYPR